MRAFWVNQGQTFEEERRARVLWAPKLSAGESPTVVACIAVDIPIVVARIEKVPARPPTDAPKPTTVRAATAPDSVVASCQPMTAPTTAPISASRVVRRQARRAVSSSSPMPPPYERIARR